jgi:hypothetical protein
VQSCCRGVCQKLDFPVDMLPAMAISLIIRAPGLADSLAGHLSGHVPAVTVSTPCFTPRL